MGLRSQKIQLNLPIYFKKCTKSAPEVIFANKNCIFYHSYSLCQTAISIKFHECFFIILLLFIYLLFAVCSICLESPREIVFLPCGHSHSYCSSICYYLFIYLFICCFFFIYLFGIILFICYYLFICYLFVICSL